MPSAAAKKPAKAPAQKVAHARIAEPVLVKGRRELFRPGWDHCAPTAAAHAA